MLFGRSKRVSISKARMPTTNRDDQLGGNARGMQASALDAAPVRNGSEDELPVETDHFGSITQSAPLDRKASGNNASIFIGGFIGALIGLMPAVVGHGVITFGVAIVIIVAVAWCSRFRTLVAASLVATALQTVDLFGGLSAYSVLGDGAPSKVDSIALIAGIWAVVGIRAVDGKLKSRDLSTLVGLVRKDFLTGVGNQRAFWEALSGSIALARRSNTDLSLVLMDMDNFKQVNDRYGHRSGDLVLKAVAEVLGHVCRESDQLFRYGGDEFAIVCPDTRVSGVEELSWRLVKSIDKMPKGFPAITACAGVAQLEGTQSASDLLDAADHTLMKVKNDGRSGSVGVANTDDRLQSISADSSEFNAQQAALQLAMASLSPESDAGISHSESVERLAILIAGRLGVRGHECEKVQLAARVHDVGSYVIPESIREKQGPLSEEEWKQVRAHVEAGERIVTSIPQLAPTAEIVRHTHERWDGNGYPDGLEGELIPLGSRIIAVCDTFQALRHDRAYRKSLTTNEALDELKRSSGTQLDPEAVDALVEVVSDKRPHGGNISLGTGIKTR